MGCTWKICNCMWESGPRVTVHTDGEMCCDCVPFTPKNVQTVFNEMFEAMDNLSVELNKKRGNVPG